MNNKKLLLHNQLQPFFSSPSIIQAVLKKSRIVKLKKGEILVEQGARSSQIGVIAKGIARWYTKDKYGKSSVLYFFGENDFITCPFSFFNNESAYGSIQALENMEIYLIDREQFDEIGRCHPSFYSEAYHKLSTVLLGFFKEKDQLLRLTAVERYLYFLERHCNIAHRIPLGQISSYLCIRQSSLSRVRREISQNGL